MKYGWAIPFAAYAMAGGCVAIPVAEKAIEVDPDTVDFADIQPKETTKSSVVSILGQPTLIVDGGSTWIYWLRTFKTGGWIVCPLYAHSYECGTSSGEQTQEYLILRFDGDASVAAKELIALARGNCSDTNVCLNEEGRLTIFADATRDARAKSFDSIEGPCVVYFYTWMGTGNHSGVEVRIDSQQRGQIYADDEYLMWMLEPGRHQLRAHYSGVSRGLTVICEERRSHFLRLAHTSDETVIFDKVEAGKGKLEIADRRLVLESSASAANAEN